MNRKRVGVVLSMLVGASPLCLLGTAQGATGSDTLEMSVYKEDTVTVTIAKENDPTYYELSHGNTVLVATFAVDSSSTNCSIDVNTANDYTFMNGSDALVQYLLSAQNTLGHNKLWNGNGDPVFAGVPCSELASAEMFLVNSYNINHDLPGGNYTDTVAVEVAAE